MNIIYIHGLDSDANSTKGLLLEKYCQHQHPDITVLRPDLNQSPEQVFRQLVSLVENANNDETKNTKSTQSHASNTVLVGSSLGGYFSTLVNNHTGCPALLLNPSTQPHITLQRFANEPTSASSGKDRLSDSYVLHSTTGGWDITNADLQWFADHQLSVVNHPDKVAVLLKEGDELLNPELAKTFYQAQGATVMVQAGGDHRFSDFEDHLPRVITRLQQLLR